MNTEIKNAKIESTMLGFEDHGLMSYMIHLDYGDSGQGFGGYGIGSYDPKTGKQNGYGIETIKRILEVVGVEKWEDLPGKHVRVECEHTKVHRIGNILTGKWFDPKELSIELGLTTTE